MYKLDKKNHSLKAERTLVLLLDRVQSKTIVASSPIITNTRITFNKNTRDSHLFETGGDLQPCLPSADCRSDISYHSRKIEAIHAHQSIP